ncbi:hypothetical protein DFH08DRAFT_960060 [Mycena albidolilacea]|uniref:Uncharacterized protein n=1 Tax=Mycena albidolilacea TaxID=1033008 RepID=A0AAD7ESL1_9AGAR|nr:hypothetical protein DFH08DRAFT_960060 [Mycena albidolilacea]
MPFTKFQHNVEHYELRATSMGIFLEVVGHLDWASGIIATDDIDLAPLANNGLGPNPPLYAQYHQRERNLPQHSPSLPYPDGPHAKFLWADNHGSHYGWGNYMQEMILNAYLAYAAQRAYVFDNYTWEREGPEISSWNGCPIPARIPLSALISGPIVGGYMRDRNVPRAVSREYYLSVCPELERVVLNTRKIQDTTLDADATVSQIVDAWVRELRSIQSPCVQLARHTPALFGHEITDTKRVLDVFPALSHSPILSEFGWSPLVLEGFYDNVQFFASHSPFDEAPLMTEMSIGPLQGLLVVHVRRGDYETWCHEAYLNSMSFTGFNSFPELPEKYWAPKIDELHTTFETTRKRCLPSISEIVEKVLSVNAPQITRVYVITNAAHPWLAELKSALLTAYNWADGISTSRDLHLSWEGKFVAEALDMYVGQRAERFIGNGFSSLTSNVVALRMSNPDLRPSDTHLW